VKPMYIEYEDPIVWSQDHGVMHVVHIPFFIWKNPDSYGDRVIRNIYKMRLWVAHTVEDDASLRYVHVSATYGITMFRKEDYPDSISDGSYHGLACRRG
jgi:hypothetical protein